MDWKLPLSSGGEERKLEELLFQTFDTDQGNRFSFFFCLRGANLEADVEWHMEVVVSNINNLGFMPVLMREILFVSYNSVYYNSCFP